MVRGLQKANYYNRLAEQVQRVEVCRKSGQKVSEWCSGQGIPVSIYYSWQRKEFQTVTTALEVHSNFSFCRKTKKDARKSALSGGAGWRFEPTADIHSVVVNETSLFFNFDFARFLTVKQGPKQRSKNRETIAITRFLRVVVNIL